MRIHHFLQPHGAQGGAPLSHVTNLAKAQASGGHDVTITLIDEGTRFISADLIARLERFCAHKVTLLPIDQRNRLTQSWSGHLLQREAARLVRETAPDILHGHGFTGGYLARHVQKSLARKNPSPHVIYSPHGVPMRTEKMDWPFAIPEKDLWPHTNGLIFESAFCEQTYLKKHGPPRCSTRIIYDGLGEDQFAPRQIIDLASDFLFFGEFRQQQGINNLIKALARMKNTHTTSALIVGSGPEEKELRAQVRRYGLAHEIFFNAPLAINTAFLKGGCLVLPSRDGAIPPALLPAAAAGMPMILTNTGGIREVVGQVKIPLIAPNDTHALQQQLVAYLADPQVFLGRAAALKRRVEKYFTLARMNEEVMQFYESIMRF